MSTIKVRTPEEIIARLEAEEKLKARGWKQISCENCKGTGQIEHPVFVDNNSLGSTTFPCCYCLNGYNWAPPREL